MFLTFKMNDMIIGHDLEVIGNKMLSRLWAFWDDRPFLTQNFRREVSF
jgi:hypothetical protein